MNTLDVVSDIIIVITAITWTIFNTPRCIRSAMSLFYRSQLQRLEKEINETIEEASLQTELAWDSSVRERVSNILAERDVPEAVRPIALEASMSIYFQYISRLMMRQTMKRVDQIHARVELLGSGHALEHTQQEKKTLEHLAAELSGLGFDVAGLKAQYGR